MKKFLLILFALFSIPVFGSELLSSEITLSNDDIELENRSEIPVLLETDEYNPYSKEALKGITGKDYDLNSAEGMFKEQLKIRFNKGPVAEAGTQFSYVGNFKETIDNKNSNLKYNASVINIGLKGKFRSDKEKFNLLFEAAPIKNGFFRELILDAWVETGRIPHHKVLFGTSRPMVGFEGGQSAFTIPFLSRSQTARNFANARKTGIKIKGDYKYLDYELGGYSSDTKFSEFFPGVETDLWVNFKPLANFNDKYGKLDLAGGISAGGRNAQDYFVTSTAARYKYKKAKMVAEYQFADGSNGAAGLSDKKRGGYNLTLSYMLTKKLEVLFRFDDFDPDRTIRNNNSKEYTGGLNFYILGQTARLTLNYVFCNNDSKPDSHKIIFGTQFLL